jgi:hypothetical protein
MAALSDYAENLLLNFLMTGTGSAPSSLHLALFSSAPNDAGGGTEISGNGYSRQTITFNTASGTGGTTDKRLGSLTLHLVEIFFGMGP